MDFREFGQAISQGIAQAFDQVHQTVGRIVDDLLDQDLTIVAGVSTRRAFLTNDIDQPRTPVAGWIRVLSPGAWRPVG